MSSVARRDLSTPNCFRMTAKSRIGGIQQLDEEMLDFNVVVGARQAQPAASSSALRVVSIQSSDNRLRIDP